MLMENYCISDMIGKNTSEKEKNMKYVVGRGGGKAFSRDRNCEALPSEALT